MGDGRVALILDVLGIGQSSGVFGEVREPARPVDRQKPPSEVEQQRMLLFRAGSFDRLAVPLSVVARLEEFSKSSIEFAGGGQVVQYRGRILPLVSLQKVLEPDSPDDSAAADPLQVVVFNDGEFSVGMVVDQILDVAEEAVTIRQKSARKGMLGSAVVGKRVTDFLDLNEVIRAAQGGSTSGTDKSTNGKHVLVLEASAFTRGMIRGSLDMAGYSVLEASTLEAALRKLEQQPVDVILAALDLRSDGSSALLTALGRRSEWTKLPVVALADSEALIKASAARTAGFQDCLSKSNVALVLEYVSRLIPQVISVQDKSVCV